MVRLSEKDMLIFYTKMLVRKIKFGYLITRSDREIKEIITNTLSNVTMFSLDCVVGRRFRKKYIVTKHHKPEIQFTIENEN